MIIFDLDGTLADCSHRRHFIQQWHPVDGRDIPYDTYYVYDEENPSQMFKSTLSERGWSEVQFIKGPLMIRGHVMEITHYSKIDFKPDWKAFYEACSEDQPIEPTIELLHLLAECNNIEIWSGRCESVRDKTKSWIDKHIGIGMHGDTRINQIKMRPIGDSTPDDELKERWLNEYLYGNSPEIEALPTMVFDDRPKVLRMWQRRGIFTFDVG